MSMSNEEIVEQIQKGINVTVNQERLWKKNHRFVKWQVRKICGFTEKDIDFEDFVQEGFIGLLTAVMRYENHRGANFLTCVGWHIRKAIIRYSENCSGSVRIPVYLKERIRKYARYRQQVISEKGREPAREEYLVELHISEKSLEHLEKTIYNINVIHVNQKDSDKEEYSLLELLQSEEDVEEFVTYSVYRKELKKALDSALSILDMDARATIQSLYFQQNSMKRTAELFGCSTQAVYEKTRRGFWKILHSSHRVELEGFMWEGYHYNEYVYSEFAEIKEEESNKFLI